MVRNYARMLHSYAHKQSLNEGLLAQAQIGRLRQLRPRTLRD